MGSPDGNSLTEETNESCPVCSRSILAEFACRSDAARASVAAKNSLWTALMSFLYTDKQLLDSIGWTRCLLKYGCSISADVPVCMHDGCMMQVDMPHKLERWLISLAYCPTVNATPNGLRDRARPAALTAT